MPYAGKTIIPREIANHARTHWMNFELTKAIAVALGESSGSLGAWNDNMDGDEIKSRDCGLYQINISASKVGTAYEAALRTDSLDPTVYEPVMLHNLERARGLYDAPWTRDGKADKRRWQPWYAYTLGWATFPEFWVWRHDADKQPIGPWVKTGRYIQKAISGQMNYHVLVKKDWTVEQALYYGKRYADHFGVDAPMQASKGSPQIVGFVTPPMPSEPPEDGHGPRPVPNDGT